MIRTIDGRRYTMRGTQPPTAELRKMYAAFVAKYPGTKTTFRDWLNRGRIYLDLGPVKPKP